MPNRNSMSAAGDTGTNDCGEQFGKKRKMDNVETLDSVESGGSTSKGPKSSGGGGGGRISSHKVAATSKQNSVGRAHKNLKSSREVAPTKARKSAVAVTKRSTDKSPPSIRRNSQERVSISCSDRKAASTIKKAKVVAAAKSTPKKASSSSVTKRTKDNNMAAAESSKKAKPQKVQQPRVAAAAKSIEKNKLVQKVSTKASTKSAKKAASVAVKPPTNAKGKSSGKNFGFWRGSRLRRMASLNAQAKVHILYENEARSPPESPDDHFEVFPDTVFKKPKNNDSSAGKSNQGGANSKTTASKAAKKRKATVLEDVRFQISSPKRMASLNAQAILAASYSLDRSRKEKVAPQLTTIVSPVPPVTETTITEIVDVPRKEVQPTTPTPPPMSIASDENVDTIMQVINAVACEHFSDGTAKTKKKMTAKIICDQQQACRKRPSKDNHQKRAKMITSMSLLTSKNLCEQIEPLNLRKSPATTAAAAAALIHDSSRRDTSGPTDVCSLVLVDTVAPFVQTQNVETTFDMDNQSDYQKVVMSPTVNFLPSKDHHHHHHHHQLDDAIEVKTEAIRRDKIEDTAEVTITGMYINPVTNTSQSFCISRIHTYKQATSTHSCYSPTHVGTNTSAGIVEMQSPQQQQQQQQQQSAPPPPQPPTAAHLVTSASGGLVHGGHLIHGGGGPGLYSYAAAPPPQQPPPPPQPQSHAGMSHGDVAAAAGLSRHYGSAFTVPHYGHHQPLPYGYYQPAGPMIQTVTTDPTCLIHKPVPFHPSGHPFSGGGGGDRMQQHQQSSTGSLAQSQQPFPADQCRAHPAAPPYPPPGPGPGPGRQQQVYAGGGGGLVVSASPPQPPSTRSSASSSSSAVPASAASSALSSPPSPPSSRAAATAASSPRPTATACGSGSTVAITAGATATAAADKCQSIGGNVTRAPPPSPSELYFADGCQSCCAAAAAAAAAAAVAVHASPAAASAAVCRSNQRQHQQRHQHQQQQRRGHYSRPSRGSPSAPPPSSPSSSAALALTASATAVAVSASAAARFHRIPSSMNAESYRKATLPSPHTKAVKLETRSSVSVDTADLQDGYANPAIAAAAKTPSRNGRQQLHLHRNKSSPPSADVVSVATSNGQRVAHIGHATPKEARLTVSLEDVLRKTATATAVQWLPSVAQRQLNVLRVDVGTHDDHNEVHEHGDDDDDEEEEEEDKRRQRCLNTHNGSLTRSKALELARRTSADCVMRTRSGTNVGLVKRQECRSKFGIRDVTNERRSSHDNNSSTTTTTTDERWMRNGYKRSILISPTTRQSGRNGGGLSLLPPRSPQPPPTTTTTTAMTTTTTTRSSRSTATSKGPSIRRLSIPCLKWNSSSSSSSTSSSLETMTTQNHAPRIRVSKKVPRYSNGWTWEGSPSQKAVYLTNDDPPVIRWCYSSMRHEQGDVIRVRDCILLKSGPRKADLPYVAKVAALWENPEDGEMMVSMLWYYRPEHTEQGRRPHHMLDEIFASKHRDVNSVACIEDKCHVLTFNEYCRYKCRIRILDEGTRPNSSLVADLEDGYPRKERQPPGRIASELVFFCRKVYDFRQKRILKNPS